MGHAQTHPARRRPLADAVPVVGPSVGETVRGAAARIERAGSDTPRLDAELLVAEALGVDRSRLVIDSRREFGPDEQATIERLVGRREAREPVAYILGRREFRHLTLEVDPRVLIPRPETELLVEVGLGLPAGTRVLDVGTGSGAVALALADERPDLEVLGIDIDPAAVDVARANAERLGLEVSFGVADLMEDGGEAWDAILANLPYVPQGAELSPEIAEYEPARALFAGRDGLALIRRLVERARALAPPPALMALELGPEQADEVSALLADGWEQVERLRDLAGWERVVVGRR
jgi:release factor glutamine methyltransferase